MFGFIVALALVVVACVGVVLDKTYRFLPVKGAATSQLGRQITRGLLGGIFGGGGRRR
jgi:hypothetical protein